MPNSLDQDQAQCSVEPDLGLNCLQKLSADDTRRYIHLLIFENSMDPNQIRSRSTLFSTKLVDTC